MAGDFDDVLRGDGPTGKGRFRLVDDDELALVTDEVIVSIAADPFTGQPINAAVSWPERIWQGDRIEAGNSRTTTIEAALTQALVRAAAWGYRGVVVSMDPVITWDPDWGELVD